MTSVCNSRKENVLRRHLRPPTDCAEILSQYFFALFVYQALPAPMVYLCGRGTARLVKEYQVLMGALLPSICTPSRIGQAPP